MKYSECAQFKTKYGKFNYIAAQSAAGKQHSVLWIGEVETLTPLLLRVQSACLTSTALGGTICDCAGQLEMSFAAITSAGRGIILYLDQEGRGHGLYEKVNTMYAMNNGADTVSAFTNRGLEADIRSYTDVGPLLQKINVSAPLICLTNNLNKISTLTSLGFQIAERQSINVPKRPEIEGYLEAKRKKLGHIIPE